MNAQHSSGRPGQLDHDSAFPARRPSARSENYRAYEQHALRHRGDLTNGKKLFETPQRTKCAVCHQIGGKGGEVGMDLSSIGGKFDRPHLIESLLEPSRQIVEGYRTTVVTTVGGKVHNGVIKEQSDEQITLVDAEGKKQTIPRGQIDELSQTAVSIMPEGLAKALSPREFTDLIAYLESQRAGGSVKYGADVVGPISVPEGFEVRTIATGLSGATALEVLPDGRVLICEQTGAVRVVENGNLLDQPFVTLPVDSYWERGVIGVTFHPDFPREPYIYACWVAKEPYPHHHVSRFTAKGNMAIDGSEKLLLVGDDQTKMGGKVPAGHQGGALHFGRDGKLYIAIGEQTSGLPSQKLDTFLGKLLRINSDGSIPGDNPFVGQAKGKYRAIWARGCRNPFTFAVRKPDGLILINDVGGDFEEINVGRAGANYGWPVVEHGPQQQYQQGKFDGPIHWYPQMSINGGDFCGKAVRKKGPGPIDRDGPKGAAHQLDLTHDSAFSAPVSDWPEALRGRYFFADFVQGWIKTLDPDDPKNVQTFASSIRRPVDLRFAPDGSLYVLLRNAWVIDEKFQGGTGSLLQIRFRGDVAQVSNLSGQDAILLPGAVDEPGPKPGDMYREYSRHNGGNIEWRVTDPNAKNPGAKKFLPNPVLEIKIDDLAGAIRAEALLDRWGGHTGTTPKQIRFNGNDWITLPELATTPQGRRPEFYYSQDNPTVEVPLEHLKPGENMFEGLCGGSAWGQWGLYSLMLRVYYEPHSRGHAVGRIVAPASGSTIAENPTIELESSDDVARVDVLAWYDGYDEDGDGLFLDWHASYHQASRGAAAELRDHVGTLRKAPFAIRWNTRFVPDQKPGAVRLLARIQDTNGFWHVAEPVNNLTLKRKEHSVKLYRAGDVPEQFGVRAGATKSCTMRIPSSDDLALATEARLHMRTWHGWDGHHAPFKLNGHAHKNEGNNHHYDYDILPIPASELKVGDNEFTIHSKTEHHMLEVLWPGPAISVRYAKNQTAAEGR